MYLQPEVYPCDLLKVMDHQIIMDIEEMYLRSVKISNHGTRLKEIACASRYHSKKHSRTTIAIVLIGCLVALALILGLGIGLSPCPTRHRTLTTFL